MNDTKQALEIGQTVAWKDPDAGQHADECEHIDERWVVGEITSRSYAEATINRWLNVDRESVVVDIPDWLTDTMENEGFTETITVAFHQGSHWHHKEYWPGCEHGHEDEWIVEEGR